MTNFSHKSGIAYFLSFSLHRILLCFKNSTNCGYHDFLSLDPLLNRLDVRAGLLPDPAHEAAIILKPHNNSPDSAVLEPI